MGLIGNEAVNTDNTDIIDIDLAPIKKKRFRINGDSSKILELNTSDVNIVSRLSKVYPKLQKLAEDATSFSEDEANDNSEEALAKFAAKLETIDEKMSKLIDELFDANVSETCKDGGSMYDPFGGMFRFEHIINTLSSLYENNFNEEFAKMRQRVSKHTSKYIK